MTDNRTTTIPFSGFYESAHDSQLDRALEQMFPDDEGTPLDDTTSRAWNAIDWRVVHLAYAQHYSEALADACDVKWQFAKLDSPREYNFRSDEIDVTIDLAELVRMQAAVDPAELAALVAKRCTSRDGFISFYSADLGDWPPLADWEAPQLALLVECYCEQFTTDEERAWELVDDCNGEITAMIEAAIPAATLTALYNDCDAARGEWSGSQCPVDPDNFWIDDATGERIPAA